MKLVEIGGGLRRRGRARSWANALYHPKRVPESPRLTETAKIAGGTEPRENAELTQERFAERVQLSKNYLRNVDAENTKSRFPFCDKSPAPFKKNAAKLLREAGLSAASDLRVNQSQ
jgi:hypothetical protein